MVFFIILPGAKYVIQDDFDVSQRFSSSEPIKYSLAYSTLTHALTHTHTQAAAWLSSDVSQRFSSTECLETRTWEQLAQVMRDKTDLFTTGSLGDSETANFHVWACFKDHPCLSVVTHNDGDAMCYVFHETEEKWYPWGLSREVLGGCTAR
jgi:hypothetical protein